LFERTVSAQNKNTDVFPGINLVQSVGANSNIRLGYSTTVNRPEFRELAEFEFTDVVGSRAVRGNPNLKRALIQNVDARWETFPGGRGVLSASVFYKYFDQPIERVVIAAANPIVTFQNSDHARNFGRAGGRPARQFACLPQCELHLRRLEDHVAAGAALGADVARASAGGSVQKPPEPLGRVHAAGFLHPPAVQLLW
jgi:hypothetical protein